jgi:hypothetical protein
LNYSIVTSIHKKVTKKIVQTVDWSHCWPHYKKNG